MFLFESSKDKELKKKVEQKYYECVGPKGRYEATKGLLISFCESSEKVAIERMVDLIKANIKDEDIPVKQKLTSMMVHSQIMQLLRDAMITRNKALGNYVVKKILQRLTILAKFKKETTDPNRGKDIFGANRKKPEQEQAAKFHQIVLECLMDWGTNWPKNADGPYKAFKENLDQLILEKVAMPAARMVSLPPPKSQGPEPNSREQQLETERRVQMQNQMQLQQQYGKQGQKPDRRQSPQPQQPVRQAGAGSSQLVRSNSQLQPQQQAPSRQQPPLSAETYRYLGGVHENFCLLGEMVNEPEPQILREIVKSIELQLQKGDAVLAQLMDRNDPPSQKAVELITDDFELIEKIKKDIQVIEAKPNKKQIFRDKYVKLLNARRAKFTEFMKAAPSGGSGRRLEPEPQQPAEREPPRQRQPARAHLEPTQQEDAERQVSYPNRNNSGEVPKPRVVEYESPPKQSNQQIPPPGPNKLQLKNESEVLPSVLANNDEPARRNQPPRSKQVKPRDSSQVQPSVAFDKFNQYQPRQSASEVEDFKMFEQKQARRASQQDFFGANVESNVQSGQPQISPQPSAPPIDFFNEAPQAPAVGIQPHQQFFEQSSQKEQVPSPIVSTRVQPNIAETSDRSKPQQRQYADPESPSQPMPFEPANPFESESAPRLRKMFESVEQPSSMNPFEKSSKNLQVTNPFDQTVLSERGIANPLDYGGTSKKQKTNPFDDDEVSSQKSGAKEAFGFAEAFMGRLDSMKESQQFGAVVRTQPDRPKQERTEQEFMNIFSKKQSLEHPPRPHQQQPHPPAQPPAQASANKPEEDPFNAFKPNRPSQDLGLDFFNPAARKTGSEFDQRSEKAFEDFFAEQHQPPTEPFRADMFETIQPAPADPYPSLPTNPFESFPPNMADHVPTEPQQPPQQSNRFKAPNLSQIVPGQFPDTFPSKFFSAESPANAQNPYPSVQDFRNFKTISSVERNKPNHLETPRSNKLDTIEVLLAGQTAKADPTNPENNPFGNPLKQDEEKVDPKAPLKPGEVVELDFQNFIAVKKIGIPWNPFQKKSTPPSPDKNELHLKMQLDRLNSMLEGLKKEHAQQKQLYVVRNQDFLEVRNQYLEKLKRLQQIQQQKHDYSKMMVRFEEDIARKEKQISEENAKIARLKQLKDRKNDCLRKLFECKIRRNLKQQEQANSRGTAASNNKFKAFNETAKQLHSIASITYGTYGTSRAYRVESVRSSLIRTRYT